MSPSRILVPLDGSSTAEAILPVLKTLVPDHAAKVYLLSVLDQADLPPRAGPYLGRACTRLRSEGVEVAWDLRLGAAADAILAYAQECQADLIAMSTHGRSGLSRLLMGSVTEEVLRHSDLPLLVCRPGTAAREGRMVIATLDGSPEAEAVLPDAIRFARGLNARLHLVQIAVPYVAMGGFGDFPMKYSCEAPLPYLEDVGRRLADEGVTVETKVRVGGAAGEILRHAEKTAATLICMTTHGRSGLDRLMLGSVAEEVLRGAPCPVLVRRTVGVAAGTT